MVAYVQKLNVGNILSEVVMNLCAKYNSEIGSAVHWLLASDIVKAINQGATVSHWEAYDEDHKQCVILWPDGSSRLGTVHNDDYDELKAWYLQLSNMFN